MKKIIKYLIYFWSVFLIIVFSMGIARYEALEGSNLNGNSKDIVHFLSKKIDRYGQWGEMRLAS